MYPHPHPHSHPYFYPAAALQRPLHPPRRLLPPGNEEWVGSDPQGSARYETSTYWYGTQQYYSGPSTLNEGEQPNYQPSPPNYQPSPPNFRPHASTLSQVGPRPTTHPLSRSHSVPSAAPRAPSLPPSAPSSPPPPGSLRGSAASRNGWRLADDFDYIDGAFRCRAGGCSQKETKGGKGKSGPTRELGVYYIAQGKGAAIATRAYWHMERKHWEPERKGGQGGRKRGRGERTALDEEWETSSPPPSRRPVNNPFPRFPQFVPNAQESSTTSLDPTSSNSTEIPFQNPGQPIDQAMYGPGEIPYTYEPSSWASSSTSSSSTSASTSSLPIPAFAAASPALRKSNPQPPAPPRDWSIASEYTWIDGKWRCRNVACARENCHRARPLGVYADAKQRAMGGNFRRKAWEHFWGHEMARTAWGRLEGVEMDDGKTNGDEVDFYREASPSGVGASRHRQLSPQDLEWKPVSPPQSESDSSAFSGGWSSNSDSSSSPTSDQFSDPTLSTEPHYDVLWADLTSEDSFDPPTNGTMLRGVESSRPTYPCPPLPESRIESQVRSTVSCSPWSAILESPHHHLSR